MNEQNKELVSLVETGQLDKAYSLYLSQNPLFVITKNVTLRKISSWVSTLIAAWIKKSHPKFSVSDDAVDLSEEFVIFWKCPNVMGRLLIKKIMWHYLLKNELPARALAWYCHWLVFQGKYKESGLLFKIILSKVDKGSRLHGEVLSLTGNYFYSRKNLGESIRHHQKANEILKIHQDKFFQMFNMGTSAKTYAEEGSLDRFRSNVLAGFDYLDPSEPDERYGMRVLIYYAYLNFISGNSELAKQFYTSAEKCYLKSGSSLDKAIYCMYKSVILIFFRDLNGARIAIQESRKQIKQFGRYESHEELIDTTWQYLYKGHCSNKLIQNMLGMDNAVKRSELESWYCHFFSTVMPIFESFQEEDLNCIVDPLKSATSSSVELLVARDGVQIEDIKEARFQVSDGECGSTVFQVELFHQDKLYELVLSTSFKKWRNPEIFESIRSCLFLLQCLSKQQQLKNITHTQSQKIKESEVARRIAHDIRSPLAALQVALSNFKAHPEDLSIIIASTQKIEDITHGLSRKSFGDELNKVSKLLVKSLIDSGVASKRVEFQGKGIDIQLIYLNSSASKYIEIHELEINRTLSNMINNAVESYNGSTGTVNIVVNCTNSSLELSIQDFGCGIGSKDLARIFEKDVSLKKDGSGLGLYYAKAFMHACGGQINVQSKIGEGSTFTLLYPLSAPPSWIKNILFTQGYERVVIADDFLPNVEMMKRKIENDCPEKEIVTFTSPADLNEYLLSFNCNSTLFLLDYDFENHAMTGVDLILQNNLHTNSIMVTHHHDDEALISSCIDSGIKLVPKVNFNELRIVNNNVNIIIADDEKYFLKAIRGKLDSKFSVTTFENADEILKKTVGLVGESFFFIDRHFDRSNIKGEGILSELMKAGKKNLYNISEDDSFFHNDALKIRKAEIENILN